MSRLLYWGIYVPVAIYIGFYLLHVFSFGGGRCKSKARMDGKTVIVTGSNSGIGKETALKLAQRGARVIMACRSRDRTQPAVDEIIAKTGNKMIVFMELDLSSFHSVEKFAKSFNEVEDRLDVLINNAGMITKEHRLTEQGLELTMMTNHLGHFLLTHLLLDKLKKSGPGSRIVNVASLAYAFANPAAFDHLDDLILDGTKRDKNLPQEDLPFPGKLFAYVVDDALLRYANSKLANVLFTKELAKRLEGTGVNAYSLHPGTIVTEIGKRKDRHWTTDKDVWFELVWLYSPLSFMMKTVEEGAQTQVCCAISEEFANQSGLYYADCEPQDLKTKLSQDDSLPENFWNWSHKVIGTVQNFE